MKLIFTDPEAPVLFVDSSGLVQGANLAARGLLQKTLEDIVGQPGGNVMNCCNAAQPNGCGQQPPCQHCVLRNSVMDTHRTGNPHMKVQACLPMDPGPPPINMILCVSTALHQGLVLVKVHELEMAQSLN